MPFISLSQVYRIAPRARDAVSTPSLKAAAPAGERDRRAARDGGQGDDSRPEGDPDIDRFRPPRTDEGRPCVSSKVASASPPQTAGTYWFVPV